LVPRLIATHAEVDLTRVLSFCTKKEAKRRASEQRKGGNAGLIPAPGPDFDRATTRSHSGPALEPVLMSAYGRLENTGRKRDLDGIAVLAILMRLLIGAQNMRVKISSDGKGLSRTNYKFIGKVMHITERRMKWNDDFRSGSGIGLNGTAMVSFTFET
jgi:hypothetical protein